MTESAEGTQTDASWVTAEAPAPPAAGAVGEVMAAEGGGSPDRVADVVGVSVGFRGGIFIGLRAGGVGG